MNNSSEYLINVFSHSGSHSPSQNLNVDRLQNRELFLCRVRSIRYCCITFLIYIIFVNFRAESYEWPQESPESVDAGLQQASQALEVSLKDLKDFVIIMQQKNDQLRLYNESLRQRIEKLQDSLDKLKEEKESLDFESLKLREQIKLESKLMKFAKKDTNRLQQSIVRFEAEELKLKETSLKRVELQESIMKQVKELQQYILQLREDIQELAFSPGGGDDRPGDPDVNKALILSEEKYLKNRQDLTRLKDEALYISEELETLKSQREYLQIHLNQIKEDLQLTFLEENQTIEQREEMENTHREKLNQISQNIEQTRKQISELLEIWPELADQTKDKKAIGEQIAKEEYQVQANLDDLKKENQLLQGEVLSLMSIMAQLEREKVKSQLPMEKTENSSELNRDAQ